ncbi:MAG: UDP-N-acetylglucosamine 2-epimerase (non-hydrolyzing) [Pseudomonadales bacterium]
MIAFEEVLRDNRPDRMLVVGDVNSTIACALDAAKLGIPIVHVEAGLRSFDRSMPEEINRILTDQISDWLFTTEEGARDNLLREGIDDKRIHFVGNVMIDTLLKHRDAALARRTQERFGLSAGKYGVVTLHRPSNVDDACGLKSLIAVLVRVSQQLPLLWPLHPRTKYQIEQFGLQSLLSKGCVKLVDSLGYLDFICCTANARMVLTDSGGVQEETTILGVPCITMRENTERPVTVSQGTNMLSGTNPEAIWRAFNDHPHMHSSERRVPRYWDGKAAERIARILLD